MTNHTPQGLLDADEWQLAVRCSQLAPITGITPVKARTILAINAALRAQAASVEPVALDAYDAGLLNDFGGGNVEWWRDYIRHELGAAHDFYQERVLDLFAAAPPSPASVPSQFGSPELQAQIVAKAVDVVDLEGEALMDFAMSKFASVYDSRLAAIEEVAKLRAALQASRQPRAQQGGGDSITQALQACLSACDQAGNHNGGGIGGINFVSLRRLAIKALATKEPK